MADLTDAELDALERLCSEATPGPWYQNAATNKEVICDSEFLVICRTPGSLYQKAADHNAALIAAARTALPALLAEVRRRRQE